MLPVQKPVTHDSADTILRSLLTLAHAALDATPHDGVPLRLGRIRGTGPGVSCGALIDELESSYPLNLAYPCEGSERVGGAVWDCRKILGDPSIKGGIAKLHWSPQARDLPMHIHSVSDRFIFVLGGRGFFHWSHQAVGAFDGSAVETIAAR